MILPTDEDCRRVIAELADDPGLTEWESEFIESNLDRVHFTDAQKEVVWRMMEKFELD